MLSLYNKIVTLDNIYMYWNSMSPYQHVQFLCINLKINLYTCTNTNLPRYCNKFPQTVCLKTTEIYFLLAQCESHWAPQHVCWDIWHLEALEENSFRAFSGGFCLSLARNSITQISAFIFTRPYLIKCPCLSLIKSLVSWFRTHLDNNRIFLPKQDH
jgi:hypothetical protein